MTIATTIIVEAENSEEAKQMAEMEYEIDQMLDGETVVYTFEDKSKLTVCRHNGISMDRLGRISAEICYD